MRLELETISYFPAPKLSRIEHFKNVLLDFQTGNGHRSTPSEAIHIILLGMYSIII